jgi:hypothetical protein
MAIPDPNGNEIRAVCPHLRSAFISPLRGDTEFPAGAVVLPGPPEAVAPGVAGWA